MRAEFGILWDMSFMVKSGVGGTRRTASGGTHPAMCRRLGGGQRPYRRTRERGQAQRTIVEEAPLGSDQAVPLGRSAHGVAGQEHSHRAPRYYWLLRRSGSKGWRWAAASSGRR